VLRRNHPVSKPADDSSSGEPTNEINQVHLLSPFLDHPPILKVTGMFSYQNFSFQLLQSKYNHIESQERHKGMNITEHPLTLHLFALGPPEVRLGENLVTFPTRKTLALLIYLAIETGLQPRKHLAALLWPEANPERSHANLRNTLGHLQTVLRPAGGQTQSPYLSVTNYALGLNPDADIDFDLRTIERAYTLARTDRSSRALPEGSASLPLLQSAAACQRGDFLAGFSLGDAPGFDDWSAIQREVWHRRMGLILDRLSEIQFTSGEFAGATETASRWIALDGLNEIAYRRNMRAHFAAGERGQALETYQVCRAVLASELGVEPEPDTTALAASIRTQPSPALPHIRGAETRHQRPDTSVAFLGNLFTGRNSEYQVLVNCFELTRAGQPQFVVLRGEAGIGKTRLARKFLGWASAQGAELLQGGAFESGSHLPFQPLVEAIRLWLEGEDFPDDLLDEGWLSPLSQLLPELRQSYPRTPQAPKQRGALVKRSAEEGDSSQVQLFEPLVQFTLALAQQAPLVLFLDDLQWADSATLEMLQYAIRRWRDRARVMLLVSLRSEALHPMTQPQKAGGLSGGPNGLIQWLGRMARELAPVHLLLKPLGEHETVEMVLSILAPPAVDFAEWLYAETRGQPFFLIETLKDLLERRVLHPKRWAEGQWTFAVDAEHDLGQAVRVPSTVHEVIRSRMNRLSPNAFSLLAGGAVLEQRITFERMCAITKVSEDQALSALDELISGRLLLETVQPGVTSAYSFTNDMLRDVVYTEAGDARRRLFHRRALEVIDAAGESPAVLAHHALAAGLGHSAFNYSLAAGREALRLSAVSEAVVHFEHALQFVREAVPPEMPDEAELGDLYTQLSKAYQMAGHMEKALAIDGERERLLLD
jgi:DNA-binding SARP family transcriptional activator